MINNRWVVLAASTMLNLTISYTYTWSVFSTPLMQKFGWTAAAAALVFTLAGITGPFAQIFGGGVLNRLGLRKTLICASVVFCASMYAASFTQSIGWIYMTYGIICAFSMAIIYICNLSNILQFFPERRGFASGILTAGSGISSIFTAPLAQHLIEAYDVLPTFRIFAVIYAVCITICLLFIRKAPKAVPASAAANDADEDSRADESGELCMNKAEQTKKEAAVPDAPISYTPVQMLKTSRFYILLILYALGGAGGLMVIGQTSNMAMEMIHTSAAAAALAVSVVSLGNTLGRVVWGVISDRFGRYQTLPFIYVIMAILFAAFTFFCRTNVASFMVVIFLIGLCFGGIVSMFPAFTLDLFGPEHNASNYGFMFFGYSFGSLIGPSVAAAFKDSGSAPYSVSILISVFLCVAGYLLAVYFKRKHGTPTKHNA